ncbi:pectinesterase-like [Andrographis paniculata]|uniref:pectinesterase-like n=1 Tax=Andrographis paniculata TaxID=175694 RepID=UPI0021E90BFD|nr:pectinesterase-like [Andrographis paniculata]
MISKIALLVVSIMVVLGVIIGVSVMVKGGDDPSSKQLGHSAAMGGPMKMVTSICELTKYKGPCARSLEPAAKNPAATSKDYILAVLDAAATDVNRSAAAAAQVAVDSRDKNSVVAVQDCRQFLNLAGYRLRKSIDAVNQAGNLSALDRDQTHELHTWTTAVYALHTYCVDQIEDPVPKTAVQIAIQNSTELSHNAVNIIAEIPQILKLFGENNNNNSDAVKKIATATSDNHPRSLTENSSSNNNNNYPAWLNSGDRKLLETIPPKPDVVVAADGSGQFKTITDAVAAYPPNHTGRFVIYVKAGDYNEQVTITNNKPNILMYGDGIGKTIVTGRKSAAGAMKTGTMHTATFANEATGFIARGMTFRNKAGPQGLQAVAFRSSGDKTAVFDCSIEGFQSTLYYQLYRHFYRNCLIYGTVDFIFGKGEALIQDSEIIVRKPMPNQVNTVTADGKEILKGSNGLVLQNCRIVPEKALFPARFEIQTFLGRPSTAEATTVVMQSELGDFIRPEGWKAWDDSPNHVTCHMLEYGNRGPGAGTRLRSRSFKNFKVLTADEAGKFAPGEFLAGSRWIPQTGVPYRLGL